MCDNLMVVAYVNKQGGTVSYALCMLASCFLRWMESLDIHLDARYLPGQSNVLADLLSRCGQVIGTEWSLHPQVARSLLRVWGNPSIDLFATSLNAKLPSRLLRFWGFLHLPFVLLWVLLLGCPLFLPLRCFLPCLLLLHL